MGVFVRMMLGGRMKRKSCGLDQQSWGTGPLDVVVRSCTRVVYEFGGIVLVRESLSQG